MTDLRNIICPVCFNDGMLNGTCTVCGYHAGEHTNATSCLPPFTFLRDKYMLGNNIGQGGFGITYLARNNLTGKRCCIKEYYPAGLLSGRAADGKVRLKDPSDWTEFEQGRIRFIEEANTLRELAGNVTVVNVEESFLENDTAYFVMELLDGCNLRTFQREHAEQVNYKMALQMLLLVGSALAEVHRFGIIHGDISPENIIITRNGEIKLIDFGAARSFRGGQGQDGKIYLKPNYAPYEQYTRKPCQGPWTDLYALAATFYYIVTGQKMIDAPSRAKGLNYVPACDLSPFISRELSAVIDCALAFDYHDRYRNVMEFLSNLEQVIRPEDYDIDLREQMPQPVQVVEPVHRQVSGGSMGGSAVPPMPQPVQVSIPPMPQDIAGIRKDYEYEPELRAVSEEKMPEAKPRGFASLFRRRKQKLAYLELTIDAKEKFGCDIRRRWLIEPNKKLTIGRHATTDVMMPADVGISREHCEVFYNEKQEDFCVKDTSKYGTYLADGTRMDKGKNYTLKNGDQFSVLSSKYMFKVVIEG